MFWFIVFLIVVALLFGVLGAVIKAAVFVVLTFITVVILFGVAIWLLVRWQLHKVSKAVEAERSGPEPPAIDDRY